MSRRFNKTDRVLLTIDSGGRCAICGEPLPPGFHADHRHPYSKGGPTDIANAQALCPRCNHKKGAKVP